jgi:hypothetical protein
LPKQQHQQQKKKITVKVSENVQQHARMHKSCSKTLLQFIIIINRMKNEMKYKTNDKPAQFHNDTINSHAIHARPAAALHAVSATRF